MLNHREIDCMGMIYFYLKLSIGRLIWLCHRMKSDRTDSLFQYMIIMLVIHLSSYDQLKLFEQSVSCDVSLFTVKLQFLSGNHAAASTQ